jgi:phosphinothricin acetyltransferase
MIRPVRPEDAADICEIYNYHVLNTVVTFEEEPVSVDEMMNRIATITARHPWLVYEAAGKVAGYAYASAWKVRSAYRHTVESSVYIAEGHIGQGVGKMLYAALVAAVRAQGIHAIIGGAALPNDASVRLHESLGFKKIGEFKEVGWKFERWVDTGYWQLVL